MTSRVSRRRRGTGGSTTIRPTDGRDRQAVARRAWLARVRTGRCMRRCGNKACRGRWRRPGWHPCPHRTGLGPWGAKVPELPVLSRWSPGELHDGADDDGVHSEPTTGPGAGGAGGGSPVPLAGGTGTDRRSAAGRPVVPGDWPGAGPVGLDHHPGSWADRHGHRDLSAAYRPPARRRAAATTESVQTGRACRLRTYVAEPLQDQWSPEQISRTSSGTSFRMTRRCG